MIRLLACVLLSLVACTAPVGVKNVSLPSDSAPRCQSLCTKIGLPLDSVVIMAENVGCVCRAVPPPSAAPTTMPPGASASVGGMAAIMIAEEAAQQQAAQQQRNNAYKPTYKPQ